MTARVSMLLKSCASLTLPNCFLAGWAKDLSAPRYYWPSGGHLIMWSICLNFFSPPEYWCHVIGCIDPVLWQVNDIFTYLLTPWCRVLLEKLTGLQLVKKFAAFYGIRRFITTLTSVCHLSLSCASPIQSTYPHPTSWRSILILSTHLRVGLPSGLFHSGFPTKILYASLSSPIRATCPAHLILNEMHCFSNLFDKVLSMFQTCPLLSASRRQQN